jgi:hypothetical protein
VIDEALSVKSAKLLYTVVEEPSHTLSVTSGILVGVTTVVAQGEATVKTKEDGEISEPLISISFIWSEDIEIV